MRGRPPSGRTSQLCDGDDATVKNLEEMSSADVLKFRVNRQVVVLNDTLRGRLWMPLQDTDLRVPDWTQIEPEEEPDEAEEETEASDTTQDLVTECSTESAPPTAADDEFGVRPGRTTILPVIDNDSSSDCGILVISVLRPAARGVRPGRGDLRRPLAAGRRRGGRLRAPPS